MRFTNPSSLLAAAAGLLATAAPRGGPSSSSFYALAAAESSSSSSSCPGGAKPGENGSCPNPDAHVPSPADAAVAGGGGVVGDSSDDSSDDDDDDDESAQRSGNPNAHRLEEGEEKPPTTCESYLKLVGFKDAVYETRSFYQEVAWSENANKPDVCMSLDDILQICHSYRPHYHEPYVHFPAAYLRDVRRIIFIGGGDAMLLHESLKYPNLEMVVGLELDQKVVRESLRHFHTQPHFDDPRVQWWFGDASKSLALLPREWFGTFDLVMVDLSETAMSISVTDDLDIFGALALLMKPEGIFVKNELYYGQMSKLFDHSIFVYMTDYPILCDQDWAMGSNVIDFMRPKFDGGHMEEGGVHTFEYTPLDDVDEHWKLIKDYSRNDARKQGKCDLYDKEVAQAKEAGGGAKEEAVEPAKPTRSAGVLLVIEADNVPSDMSALAARLEGLLEDEGLHPLPPGTVVDETPSGGASSALFLAMEEGYVNAHHYPASSHVGLDVVLWSKIAKLDDLRVSLLGALGAELSDHSSYRVIHGGMLGAKNWREDVNAVGPVNRNLRQCDPEVAAMEPKAGPGPMDDGVFAAAVTASLSMLPKKMDKVIAVLCGTEGEGDCAIVGALKKHSKVDKVVAIWDCPGDGMAKTKDDDEVVSKVYICGPKDLKRSAKIEEGYSAVVIDPKASQEFVSSLMNEFCKKGDTGQHVLLRDTVTIMTSLANDAEVVFYASCVKNLIKHMVRSSRIVIDGTAQYGIIGTNNPSFVRRVVSISDSITKQTGLRTMIEKMVGGPVQQQKEYDPEHYPPNAYDERDALKQYTNQVPLASQSLYQIEVSDESDIKKLSGTVIKNALDAVVKSNVEFAGAKRVDYADEIGDGSVSAAILASGHLVVTWDGAGRLTLNTMTNGEEYVPIPPNAEVPDMVLSNHKLDVVAVFLGKLPPSAKVAVREQMPRGSNRVVNFRRDINAIPNCTDHYDLCTDFAKDGECDDEEEQPWMHKYCSLSCGTCDKMNMGQPIVVLATKD
jgi:spermidine synthase